MIRPGTVETARFPEHAPTGTWDVLAACRGMDPAIFFPDDRDGEKRAIAICMSCPVQDECMEHAITANEDDGVWGGTTPKHRDEIVWERGEDERRKARKRKSRERKPL